MIRDAAQKEVREFFAVQNRSQAAFVVTKDERTQCMLKSLLQIQSMKKLQQWKILKADTRKNFLKDEFETTYYRKLLPASMAVLQLQASYQNSLLHNQVLHDFCDRQKELGNYITHQSCFFLTSYCTYNFIACDAVLKVIQWSLD